MIIISLQMIILYYSVRYNIYILYSFVIVIVTILVVAIVHHRHRAVSVYYRRECIFIDDYTFIRHRRYCKNISWILYLPITLACILPMWSYYIMRSLVQ